MDRYGVGTAVQAALSMYRSYARGTGRTTLLLDSLRNGDRVIFAESRHASYFQMLCAERELAITCMVIPVREFHRMHSLARSEGKTVFDHTWIELFYEQEIRKNIAELDYLETSSSGPKSPYDITVAFK